MDRTLPSSAASSITIHNWLMVHCGNNSLQKWPAGPGQQLAFINSFNFKVGTSITTLSCCFSCFLWLYLFSLFLFFFLFQYYWVPLVCPWAFDYVALVSWGCLRAPVVLPLGFLPFNASVLRPKKKKKKRCEFGWIAHLYILLGTLSLGVLFG